MKIGIAVADSKTQYFINQAYVDLVAMAGFEPILISPSNSSGFMAEICDGLLLPGGIDIDPIYYNEDNIACYGSDEVRDTFERNLMNAFIHRNKKIFGICRGFQLMVREFIHRHPEDSTSLTFFQHVNDHALADERKVARSARTHSVSADVTTLYGKEAAVYEKIFVNSMHHQALIINQAHPKTIGVDDNNSFEILAATTFGTTKKEKIFIVEGVDIKLEGCNLRGVQWHPEELKEYDLLHAFFGMPE